MAKKKAADSKKKPLTKTQVISNISESSGLSKKEVTAVFEALSSEIEKALGRSGPGVFTIPGLIKVVKKHVPAKPARKNVMVLGQLRDIDAKPATTKVQVRALKALKEMA